MATHMALKLLLEKKTFHIIPSDVFETWNVNTNREADWCLGADAVRVVVMDAIALLLNIVWELWYVGSQDDIDAESDRRLK